MSRGDLVSVGVVHCLVQIAWCRGAEPFFCALESALRLTLIDPTELGRIRRAVPAPLRNLVDLARTDADSGLESLVRLRLHRLGSSCACQVPIPGVVRDAVAMAHGFVTLRFDAALILHEWEVVEAAILAALVRGLHESDLGRRVRAGR